MTGSSQKSSPRAEYSDWLGFLHRYKPSLSSASRYMATELSAQSLNQHAAPVHAMIFVLSPLTPPQSQPQQSVDAGTIKEVVEAIEAAKEAEEAAAAASN